MKTRIKTITKRKGYGLDSMEITTICYEKEFLSYKEMSNDDLGPVTLALIEANEIRLRARPDILERVSYLSLKHKSNYIF